MQNIQRIQSLRNPAVQAAKALQNKADRDQCGLFLCEGEHMAGEALRHDASAVVTLFVEEGREALYTELLNMAGEATIYSVPAHILQAISQVKTAQGIAAVVQKPAVAAWNALNNRVVLLENVQDPGNVGTILRTADAAGFTGCVLTPGCADLFSPKALRATMGSVFRIPCVQATNAATAIHDLAEQGYAVIAATLTGDDFYRRTPLPPRQCLMIGNEGAGLTPQAIAAATHRYRLPMAGGTESLNAAIAAAIMMYDLVNHA